MPVYYQIDPLNPVISGAAMGFEMFERAAERRERAADRKRAIALEDERMKMTRETHEATMADREQRLKDEAYDRNTAYDNAATGEVDAGLRTFGEDHTKWSPEQRAQVAGRIRAVNPNAANETDDALLGRYATRAPYLQAEAVKDRDVAEREATVAGVLERVAGAQQPAAEAAAPAGKQQGGGPPQGGGPRGIRNNNPGNIRATNIPWQGKVGSDGEFEQFATPEDGLRAASLNLITGARKGADTVRSAIARWAPPSENDTGAYVARVAKELGVSPDEKLDLRDPEVNARLLGAIVAHENGKQPYTQEQLLTAARRAVGNTEKVLGAGYAVATEYAKTRSKTSPEARDALDAQVQRSTAERLQTISADLFKLSDEIAANGGRMTTPQRVKQAQLIHEKNQLKAASTEIAKAAAADAAARALPRPAKPGDTPAAALEPTLAAERQGAITTNAAEQRAIQTRLNRLSDKPPARYTKDDVKFISRAIATGAITFEQGYNALKYNSLEKPDKPTITNFGMGLGVMVDENGNLSVIDFVDQMAEAEAKAKVLEARGKALDEAALLKPQEMRQRLENNIQSLFNLFKEQGDKGVDLPSGPNASLAAFNEAITRFGPELEQRFNIRTWNPYTQGHDISQLTPGQVSILANAFINYYGYEIDEFMKNGKSFTDYVGELVPGRQPAAAQTEGVQATAELDGKQYVNINGQWFEK